MGDKFSPSGISSQSLTVRLVLLTAAMFGFGFLLVPLYDAFCEVTGFGGRTNETAAIVSEKPDRNRDIELELVTTVNEYAPLEFRAAVDNMRIHPGELYEAKFVAHNLTGRGMIAQAVPSVAPSQAAKYFKKLDCFCFESQAFAANEERELLVRFIVDSELPDYVDTITLSYTFFDTARLRDNSAQMANPAHTGR
jgi:cytochrome c oxidase assembly protein subunit 11